MNARIIWQTSAVVVAHYIAVLLLAGCCQDSYNCRYCTVSHFAAINLDSRFGEKSDTGIALTAVWQRFKRAIAKDEKWVKETSNSMIELPMSAQWRTHHAIYSFGIFDSKRPFFRAHFGARLWRMEHLDFRFLPVLGTANPFSSGDFERAEVVKAINLVSLLPQFKPAVPGDVVTGNDAT